MTSSSHFQVLVRDLPSTLTAYHDFVQEILSTLQSLNWPESDLFGVHMALEESISNAIRHGNKEDPDKLVHVECELAEKRFVAKVCDEGVGYEPADVPDCCSPEGMQATGGRGLQLIKHYMTTVKHNDCGRCLVMEKLLD